MKQLLAILLAFVTLGSQLSGQSTQNESKSLYPFVENERWGYIDKSGKVLIEAKFPSAGQFSEGVAPARLDGTYGYIDGSGEFIIAPQYDMAFPFRNGEAKVFIGAKPYYIDSEGRKTFEHEFAKISGFGEYGVSIVITTSEKYGIINRKGELLVDTIYKEIAPFADGRAIVTGLNHKPYTSVDRAEPVLEVGVIDYLGDFVVPFGKFKGIGDFVNGFAKVQLDVERQKGHYDSEGIIDTVGSLRFIVPAKKWHFDYGNYSFSEGLASVDIYSVDPDTVKSWSSRNRYTYKGVINADGEIVFSNEGLEEITPFRHNRAFIQDLDENWHLIDRKGQILNEEPYQKILYQNYGGNQDHLFQDGIQFVKTAEGQWGAIDTTGLFAIAPRDLDYPDRDLNRRGDILFFKKNMSTISGEYDYRYGFWNIRTGAFVPPQFHRMSLTEFSGDLHYVLENGRIGYIDKQGAYVWRAKPKEDQEYGGLNIDYMNRGYFYASSPYKEELAGHGGWGGSRNVFKRIYEARRFEEGKLTMVANPEEKAKYAETFSGLKLYVANTAQDTLYFDAQDSRLYLKIQALDESGRWRDIEYLPSSWCGNSYHSLFLPPDHYWEFTIPVYEGQFTTKLRAELLYKTDKNQKEDAILYSNEFIGSINPGQFWRKESYTPMGLMDPYYD